MKVHDVAIQPVTTDTGNELSEKFYRCCGFCEKLVKITGANLKSCSHLSGKGFYCPFCLRHNFHHKSNRHILVLSFCAIIANYYYKNYSGFGKKKMWMNEIRHCISTHRNTGLQNPVFSYDPVKRLVTLSTIQSKFYGVPLAIETEDVKLIDTTQIQILEKDTMKAGYKSHIVQYKGQAIDINQLGKAEKQFRASFDRYDEFSIFMQELAYGKYSR